MSAHRIMTYYLELHDSSGHEGCVPFNADETHVAIETAKWLISKGPAYNYAQIRAADGRVIATIQGQVPSAPQPVQANTRKQLTLDL